jgi:hypothetical protein
MGAPGGPLLDDSPEAATRHARMLDRFHLSASHGGLNLTRMMDLKKKRSPSRLPTTLGQFASILRVCPPSSSHDTPTSLPTAALASPVANVLIQARSETLSAPRPTTSASGTRRCREASAFLFDFKKNGPAIL